MMREYCSTNCKCRVRLQTEQLAIVWSGVSQLVDTQD